MDQSINTLFVEEFYAMKHNVPVIILMYQIKLVFKLTSKSVLPAKSHLNKKYVLIIHKYYYIYWLIKYQPKHNNAVQNKR